MKKLFLIIALFSSLDSLGQVNQVTARRVFASDSLRLVDIWLRKVSTNILSSDSNSHNMIATNRAIMDAIRAVAGSTGINEIGNGLSISGDSAALGQLEGDVSNPAILLNPRQIPLNGNNIRFSGDTGNIIIGDTTQAMDWRRIGRVQINSDDTTHPLLTIGPSPASDVTSIFSDNKAQLVIGLVDTPRHNLSQQNLKAGALILAHKSYFPKRTRERLGAKRYAMQSLKAYFARDTVDFQSGNPGGDLIGAYHGENSYNQFPGYAGRTIYISDSIFGSEPHVGNSNSVYVASTRTRNNLVSGDAVYLKGWYAAYNTQLLMSNPDTIENYVHFLGGQTVIGGGTGTANIKKEYFFYPIHKFNGPNQEIWGFYDKKHPAVPGNFRYNWFGHKTGIGDGRERPRYMLDVDGSVAFEKDSTPIITSIGSNYLLTIDTSANPGDSNRVKRILPSDLGLGGIAAINGQSGPNITFNTGTTGTDFNVSAAANTITYNLPSASTANRGAVTTGSQTFGGDKTFNDGITVTSSLTLPRLTVSGDLSFASQPGVSGTGMVLSPFNYEDAGAARTVIDNQTFHRVGQPTINATNAVTYTDIATFRINGAPIAGTNMTITRPRSLRAQGISHTDILAHSINESSGAAVNMGATGIYIALGTTATYTLPDLETYQGVVYYVKNAGSGDLTLQRGGSDDIYDTSTVTSIIIAAGQSREIVAGSTAWYIIN